MKLLTAGLHSQQINENTSVVSGSWFFFHQALTFIAPFLGSVVGAPASLGRKPPGAIRKYDMGIC